MAYGSRLARLGLVIGLSVGLGACSTMDLRGRTQSVADDSRGYSRPAYSGRQGLVRPAKQPLRNRQLRQIQAGSRPDVVASDVRYYRRNKVPPRLVDQRHNYTQPSTRPVNRQAYALPPRVERRALPDAGRRPQRAERPLPSSEPTYQRSGWARWIGRSWLGHKTASGEIFDAGRLTGAHASLPVPSFVYVTNKRNGRSILIRVNDRVPAAKDRVIILSQWAAELLDFRAAGRVQVDIQYGGPASPVPNEKHERAFLKQQPWYRSKSATTRPASPLPAIQSQSARRYPKPTYPRWDDTRR